MSPVYEYRCRPCQATSTDITTSWRHRSASIPCSLCGRPAGLVPSAIGAVYPPYPQVDGGEVWKGTPLEGVDGRNPVTHKSDTPFVDLGSKE